ncbi:MAG: LamG domain-containing protein [Candidatus Nanohaloarchaea archaeon]
MSRKGQAINIDWSVGLGLFLITTLSSLLIISGMNFGPGDLQGLRNKASSVQDQLIKESSYSGRQVPLIVRAPVKVNDIPIDREYDFPASTNRYSGVMDIPAEVNVTTNQVRTVIDALNKSYRMTFFFDNVSDITYGNTITATASRINVNSPSGNISVNPGQNGLTSLKINGNELLRYPSDLGSSNDTIIEKELHAYTLNGDLKTYSGTPEMILENSIQTTWYFTNTSNSTLYWRANNRTYYTDGTGDRIIKQGVTDAFTIADNRGITFLGNMTANITKPNSSTIKAVIKSNGKRLRIRPQDSGIAAGYRRALLYTDGDIMFGASHRIDGPTYEGLTKLQNMSKHKFEKKLDLQGWGYNISFIDYSENTTALLPEWTGTFEGTSVSRNRDSGDLGIGYPNGNSRDSLAGFWRLDKAVSGSGGTVEDYSGNNNDGTTYNGVKTGAPGILNTSGYNITGDDYFEIPETDSLNSTLSTNDMAISFWIKPTVDTNSWDTLLSWNVINANGNTYTTRIERAGSDNNSLYTRFIADHESCGMNTGDGGFWARSSNMGLNLNEWNLYTVTYDGNQVREYTNGVLQEQSSPGCDLAQMNSKIKVQNWAKGYQMDELRIYNRSLSDSDVRHLYFDGIGGGFNGNYTLEQGTNQVRTWRSIKIKADIPSGTSVDMRFTSLDDKGTILGAQSFDLKDGENSYTIKTPSSKRYRLKFTPRTGNITTTPIIHYYTLKYGRGVVRGDKIPLTRSVIVNTKPNALINRTGGFETMKSEVAIWR